MPKHIGHAVTVREPLRTQDIRHADSADRDLWNEYVAVHPAASLFHLFEWRDVVRRAYGHEVHYLMAVRRCPAHAMACEDHSRVTEGRVIGIFPLVHLKHPIFGNRLVSLPFLDGGGVLADSREVEMSLLSESIRLGRKVGASTIDMRCEAALSSYGETASPTDAASAPQWKALERSDKVRMLLSLPGSVDLLAKSFKSKLRSQINRPIKEGCTSKTGGLELLDDFYRVFLVNMRDLGSPVHSKELMRQVLLKFPRDARTIVVYKSGMPVAAALVVGFKETLRNPWASSDRKFASMSPNMLLYLRMLEFACENGYRVFDFGRSTIGEGTFRFKEQWGAVPTPLHWYLIPLDGKLPGHDPSGKGLFRPAVHCWRKLPLGVTRIVGPLIRKHISL